MTVRGNWLRIGWRRAHENQKVFPADRHRPLRTYDKVSFIFWLVGHGLALPSMSFFMQQSFSEVAKKTWAEKKYVVQLLPFTEFYLDLLRGAVSAVGAFSLVNLRAANLLALATLLAPPISLRPVTSHFSRRLLVDESRWK